MHDLLPLFGQSVEDENLIAFLFAFFIAFSIIFFILYVILVIPLCLIYKKAGKPWFAAIIPFWNIYVAAQIIGRNPLLILGGTIGSIILSGLPYIGFVAPILGWAINAVIAYDLAKVFGMSQGFSIANIFLSPILNFYLAFSGDAQYRGPLAGAEERILMEAPWLDPALGVAGINPYAAHTYTAYGQSDPNASAAYTPPGYNPQAGFGGQPGAPTGEEPMPNQPTPPSYSPMPDPTSPSGADTPAESSPGASSWGAPPSQPAQPATTSASDWTAPPAPSTPPPAPPQDGPAAPQQDGPAPTDNPFGSN